MSLGKKDIVKDIATKAQIPTKLGNLILNEFIAIVTRESIKHPVKISNFGTFYLHKSPKRIGRNPKTGVEAPITERNVVTFTSSNVLKSSFK
jgi:integration host factor subunit alpha